MSNSARNKIIKICSWNCNGIKNRIGSLTDFLNRRDIDIMLLNDTRLAVTDKLKVSGYKAYRTDRRDRAGGVAILVRCNIPHATTDLPRTNLETLAILLQNNVRIIAVYNRPNNRLSSNELASLLTAGSKCLLVGDLNVRYPV